MFSTPTWVEPDEFVFMNDARMTITVDALVLPNAVAGENHRYYILGIVSDYAEGCPDPEFQHRAGSLVVVRAVGVGPGKRQNWKQSIECKFAGRVALHNHHALSVAVESAEIAST